ncbi:E3 ubiquitin-protein ligase SINA-like 2 [Capsella rubella]|uniref:E3 ubiquitin-protein ligase SINA-like 2 n=1 Tax=Capsella rubella TaxID=81985 RepID=UPI000CD4E892|nr:E3 ubiquitin-protein ligase SINA-like 2 [Capsella rubella]
MDKVVEAINVPCPDANHGCPKKFSYGKELVHQDDCYFTRCYFPTPNRNYMDVYEISTVITIPATRLVAQGSCVEITMMHGYTSCFKEEHGLYVTMNCTAPITQGVGEFCYDTIYVVKRKIV